jgi:hypothetical protein
LFQISVAFVVAHVIVLGKTVSHCVVDSENSVAVIYRVISTKVGLARTDIFSTNPSKVPPKRLLGRLLINTGMPKNTPMRLSSIALGMSGLSSRKVTAPNEALGVLLRFNSLVPISVISARFLMFDSEDFS